MRISRVRIENFRNFHELDIAPGSPMVLVGENKVGKSNFLHALRLVLDPSLPDSARHLRREDFWDGLQDPLGNGERITISVELTDFEDDEDVLATLCDHLVETEPLTSRLTYTFELAPDAEDNAGRTDAAYQHGLYGGDRPENEVSGGLRRLLPLTVLPALRDAEGDLLSWRRSPLRPLLDRAAASTPPETLVSIAGAIQDAASQLTDLPDVKRQSDAVEARIRSMVGEHQTLGAALGISPTDPDKLIRSLRMLIDGGVRDIGEASLGSANVLYLALKSLEFQLLVDEGAREHTFLAIEEPEAHLHPHLQRLVYRDFLRSRTHLGYRDEGSGDASSTILTTHSPHIASVAPLRSIVVLRATEGDGTAGAALCHVDFAPGEEADLERYLEVTRAELLFSRGVLLVEGEAESYLLPALAGKLGTDLDELGISVCSIAGTHFTPYADLLDALGTPYAVLTDRDPVDGGSARGERRAIRLLKTYEEFAGLTDAEILDKAEESGIFLNEVTLEVDLLRTGPQDVLLSSLADLAPGAKARSRARGWLDDPSSVDEGRMLRDVDQIGKGRFAQRMATRIAGLAVCPVPSYIENAIQHVADRCS